uniref:Uncharacterized protein n=1 Tax=Corvus moneduloides TaxID=1196302 RepID=A0A8C3DRG7_CORMO
MKNAHFSSESLEQSFPAAALRSCKITDFSPAILPGTNTSHFHASKPYYLHEFTFTYSFVFRAFRRSRTGADNANPAAISRSYNILAKPRALEALSLASWNSSFILSSALAQNSSQLSCSPESKNIPVDFSSIPAISL